MKHFFLPLLLLFLTGFGINAENNINQGVAKIGILDKDSLINALAEKKEIDKTLTLSRTEYEKEYKRMQQEYNKKIKDYLEKNKSMTDAIKLARQSEITESEKRIALYKERFTAALHKERDSLYVPLLKQIHEAIKKVADEIKITLVLDKSTPLFFSSECVDITALVEEKIKKKTTNEPLK